MTTNYSVPLSSNHPLYSEIRIRENLLNLWQGLLGTQGWEILEDHNLLCLKSPTNAPNLNICWEVNSQETLKEAHRFFEGKTFGLITEDTNLKWPFVFPAQTEITIIEMYFANPTVFPEPPHPTCQIMQIEMPQEFEEWSRISQGLFGLDSKDALAFLHPVSRLRGADFFIAYQDQIPVGIGHIYIDNKGLACLSSIGVLEDYRRKGIGTEMMKHCINTALEKEAVNIALHASEVGVKLYETLGFKSLRPSKFSISLPLET